MERCDRSKELCSIERQANLAHIAEKLKQQERATLIKMQKLEELITTK